jgi:hypothetical protein
MATLLTDECLVIGEPAGCWKDRGRRNHGGRAGPRGPARLGTGARRERVAPARPHRTPGRTTTGIGDADAAGARRRAVFLAGPRVCSCSAVPLTFGGGWYVRCGRTTVASDSFFLFSPFFFVLLYYIATPIEMLYFIYLFYCRCLYGPHPCTTLFMCPCPERPGTPLARCVCWDVPVVAFLLCLFGQDTVATCRDARSRSRLRNASAILRLCAQITLI